MLTHHKSRYGFNLVEAAIVLGVIGLVIGGIWTAAASVERNRKLNQSIQIISMSYSNLAVVLKNMPLGAMQINGQLLRTVVPPGTKIASSNTYIEDEFGNQIMIFSDISGSVLRFAITFMDESVCPSYTPRLYTALKGSIVANPDGLFIYDEDGENEISTPSGAALHCTDEVEFMLQY